MDNEILEAEKPVETIDDAQKKIDALFSQYETVVAEPEKVDVVQPVIEPVQNVQQPVAQQPTTDPAAPYGYYQKGKKKGQPRPTPYTPLHQRGLPVQPVQQIDPKIQGGILITGGLFLTLINLIIPLLVSVLNNWLTDTKIKPEQMQLSKEQIKELDPVCDAVMKQMTLTGNPMVLLFIGLFSAYGLKFMDLKLNGK